METIIIQVLFEVQALGDFPGEEDEDLGFKDREILTILESRYILYPIRRDGCHHLNHSFKFVWIVEMMVGSWLRMHWVKEATSLATMSRYSPTHSTHLHGCGLNFCFVY